MHDIICPHCSKAFKIDEAGYADILKQVRDSDFEQQLYERLELAERDKRAALELAQAKAASELQQAASAKDQQISDRVRPSSIRSGQLGAAHGHCGHSLPC